MEVRILKEFVVERKKEQEKEEDKLDAKNDTHF
jgi:hypothetical protein